MPITSYASGHQKGSRLLRVQRRDLVLSYLRRVYPRRRVERYQVEPYRLLQRTV